MDLMQKYNENLERAESRFGSLLSGNKEKLMRTAMNVILTIVVLAVFGCLDFVNMEWDWTRIITYAFWTKVSSKTIAAICCFNIGINFNWEYALERFFELKEAIVKYDILIKQKDDKNFEYYVNQVYNKESKIKAWINKINRKIYHLDLVSKNRYKLLYTSDFASEDEKNKNKYCRKRKEYELLKQKEYIEKNVDNLVVRYSKVNPNAFAMDIQGKVKDEDNRVVGNVGLGRVKATANIVWGVVLITAFMSVLIVSLNQEEFVDQMQAFVYYLLNAVVDIGIIAWNIFRGTRACKPIIIEQIHTPYCNRNKVLVSYIEWKETNKIEPSKSFTKINELVNEENNIIELSEEEAKNYLQNHNNR